ncbi:hypothetical protein ACFQZ4_07845 [Catellatospora coxensis]
MAARTADLTGGRPVVPSRGVLRPLGLSEVRITGASGRSGRRPTVGRRSTTVANGWTSSAGPATSPLK